MLSKLPEVGQAVTMVAEGRAIEAEVVAITVRRKLGWKNWIMQISYRLIMGYWFGQAVVLKKPDGSIELCELFRTTVT